MGEEVVAAKGKSLYTSNYCFYLNPEYLCFLNLKFISLNDHFYFMLIYF